MSTYRAVCGVADHHCTWTRETDTVEGAIETLQEHLEQERDGELSPHYGATRSVVVELVDERTARLVAHHVYDRAQDGFGESVTVERLDGEDRETPNRHHIGMNGPDGIIPLRRTPPGQPTVADLVERGTLVETSYGTGPYKVIEVSKYRTYSLPHYSIIMVAPKKEPREGGTFPDNAKRYVNDLVAQDGEIRKLFAANEDTVMVQGMAEKFQPRLSRWA